MRALAILLLAGCNQILGGNITGPDDDSSIGDGGDGGHGGDGGAAQGDGGEHVDDADTSGDGSASSCAWSTPVPIAPFAMHPVIAAARDGAVHVAYEKATTALAYLSRAPGASWSTATELGNRSLPQIAVDANGAVHLIAKTPSDDLVYLSRPALGSWSVPTMAHVPEDSHVIAAGPTGPIVATANNALFWAQPATASWQLAPASYIGSIGYRPAIAISSSGAIHLFANGSGFFQNTGDVHDTLVHVIGVTQWSTATIDDAPLSPSMFGDGTLAVVVDGDIAHLLYTAGVSAHRQLAYRRRIGEQTASAAFMPDAATIDGIAAAIDADGSVHVITHDVTANNLRYQRRTASGTWSAPIAITDAGTAGADATVAIDGTGVLHLAWTDTQQRLVYATRCTSP